MSASSPSANTTVDVSSVVDNARLGPVQIIVLVFMFIVQMTDGFDIQAIAFTAPALTEEWGISRAALGPVLAAALLGMALGATSIGPVGDRHGRKTALIICCLAMAVGSLASAFASGPVDMAIYRFITGIGLGGALPNSTALIFEFAPRAWRQVVTSVALVGLPLGGMLGAALARWLIPEFGWQSLFIVGSALPALLAVAMYALLPESPRYLCGQPSRYGELAKLLGRLDRLGQYGANLRYVGGAATEAGKATISALFTPGYRRDTLTLWLIFFTNVFSVYFFFSWLPTVLSAANLSLSIALSGSLYFNLGGVAGTIVSSAIIGRYGSKRILAVIATGSIVSVAAIGANAVFVGQGSVPGLMWTMAAAGACLNAVQIGMFSVAANVYPTDCRSTGVGWAVAVSRFGSIASSFVGSAFFALGMTAGAFFYFIAAILVLTLIGVVLLRRHIPAVSGTEPASPAIAPRVGTH